MPTVTCTDRHLAPTDPVGEAEIAERELTSAARSAVHHIEPQRLQTTRARARGRAMGDDLERNPPAVQRQDELVGETGRIVRLPNICTDLIRRDLRDI